MSEPSKLAVMATESLDRPATTCSAGDTSTGAPGVSPASTASVVDCASVSASEANGSTSRGALGRGKVSCGARSGTSDPCPP